MRALSCSVHKAPLLHACEHQLDRLSASPRRIPPCSQAATSKYCRNETHHDVPLNCFSLLNLLSSGRRKKIHGSTLSCSHLPQCLLGQVEEPEPRAVAHAPRRSTSPISAASMQVVDRSPDFSLDWNGWACVLDRFWASPGVCRLFTTDVHYTDRTEPCCNCHITHSSSPLRWRVPRH